MLDSKGMVWAAQSWPTNADLIVDVARLYLHKSDRIISLASGKGTWWTKWCPQFLYTNDIDHDTGAMFADDFRRTRWNDSEFDVVIFDPPYVCIGGRKTTTIPEHHKRYGMMLAPETPALLHKMIFDGLCEAHRIVRPGGLILIKCMPYISSGKYQDEPAKITHGAWMLSLEKIDQFVMVGEPGRQSQTTQKHARNNYSVLFVFQKAR